MTNLGSFGKQLGGLDKHKPLASIILCKYSPLFMFSDTAWLSRFLILYVSQSITSRLFKQPSASFYEIFYVHFYLSPCTSGCVSIETNEIFRFSFHISFK